MKAVSSHDVASARRSCNIVGPIFDTLFSVVAIGGRTGVPCIEYKSNNATSTPHVLVRNTGEGFEDEDPA